MADNQYFQYINKRPYFKKIYGKSNLWLKAYSYPHKGHCTKLYQDGGGELQNLITKITAMRDPGLFISVAIAAFQSRDTFRTLWST